MRNQTDIGTSKIATLILLLYQRQFLLFLCDQVIGGETSHNGLKSSDTDHYCWCYTQKNIARVTLFMWDTYTFKHVFQILLQDYGHFWTKSIEYTTTKKTYWIYYFVYRKLINIAKLRLKTCIMWHMQKVTLFSPKSNKFSMIILQKKKICENKFNL